MCHVLHRLLMPRHPPEALSSFTCDIGDLVSFAARLLRCANRFVADWSNRPTGRSGSGLTGLQGLEMRGLEPLASSVQGRRSPD